MTGAYAGRDDIDVDALVTDRYLEVLLAAHARGVDAGPSPADPRRDIRLAADRLARELPRFHPSFRFEEALAARLAEVAVRMRLPAAAGAEGFSESVIVPIRPVPGPGPMIVADGEPDAERSGFGRPLLIGGALTSAALSLAGAAYVAWRLNRPPASSMARAARAVARARPA